MRKSRPLDIRFMCGERSLCAKVVRSLRPHLWPHRVLAVRNRTRSFHRETGWRPFGALRTFGPGFPDFRLVGGSGGAQRPRKAICAGAGVIFDRTRPAQALIGCQFDTRRSALANSVGGRVIEGNPDGGSRIIWNSCG